MKSVAQHHFPRYVFRDGSKLLWNPVLKKAFIDRPEERVRLQLVDYLILEAGFSTSRISFESPVHLPRDKSASRTDVICFDRDFQPLLLIECKAPEISLTDRASIQIARYNQKVDAPLLLISNGLEDFWFKNNSESVLNLKKTPEVLNSTSKFETDFKYWSERGFAGEKTPPNTHEWILESCTTLFGPDNHSSPSYFKFEGINPELYMANYYRVFQESESIKLALSFTSTPNGTTKLNGVLNLDGSNSALFSCSIDLIAVNDPKNTIVESASGTRDINLAAEIDFNLDIPIIQQVSKITEFLSDL